MGLALAPDGRLFSWGSNQEGSWELGPSTPASKPGEVRMPDGVIWRGLPWWRGMHCMAIGMTGSYTGGVGSMVGLGFFPEPSGPVP